MLRIVIYTSILASCFCVAAYKIYIFHISYGYLAAALVIPWLGFKLGKAITRYRRDRLRYLNKLLDRGVLW